MITNNENISVCSACGGKCCKNMPGILYPEDIKEEITVDVLVKYYQEGYQFDYYEGSVDGSDKIGYYLRPQTIRSKDKIVDASSGGQCIFLEPGGCSKIFDDRPTECKALIPDKKYGLNCGYDKYYSRLNAAIAWLSYNEIIEETIDRLIILENERKENKIL